MGNYISKAPVLTCVVLIFATTIYILTKKNKKIKNDNIVKDAINSINNNNININNKSKAQIEEEVLKKFRDYDIVIDLASVDTFVIKDSSWTIYISDQVLKDCDPSAEYPIAKILEGSDKYKTITVIGYFKRGKTFVINLINDFNLPSGSKNKTKGLSMIISQATTSLFIDTQGGNTPLPCHTNDVEDAELQRIYNISTGDPNQLNNLHLARKKATESFIQEVAIGLSNLVIFVVNEMTWSDQQNIMALQKKIMNQESKASRLYVIHNFMNVDNEKDLIAMIKTYVTTPFKGRFHPDFECDDLVVHSFADAANNTTHFFLCDDNSEFGHKWNRIVAKLIRNNIKGIIDENKEFDTILLKTIKEKMKVNIKYPSDLKIVPYKNEELSLVEKHPKKKNFSFNREKNNIKPHMIKALDEYEELFDQVAPISIDINQIPMFSIVPIEYKVDGKIDHSLKAKDIDYIDNNIVVRGGYKPPFDRIEDENSLTLVFDIPFIFQNDINHMIYYDKDEDCMVLRVWGIRELKYKTDEKDVTDNGSLGVCKYSPATKLIPSSNSRKEGEYDLRIPIQACYGIEYETDFENGMLNVMFKNILNKKKIIK
ncbi:hypothetical protein DICPUDRAFT_99756 [Dictyostelium purpureum]|uniref:G domain-containing protein n=1 Tax=Dictyostelium purpureum TaxID=5786 RepID=F1A285_DICPU|nr:uncharacterized protein DICPUDRAFT_99756 [Dictyostelium purpureum]EGC29696.1 hypothetical protein DICPUDRAFT_99756 [Dictyostelium purpureum]|eukprot:XP_003293778.1 hypothetical protein DICPUDRAFT_99756 [Dictyostelium purpureum]